MKTIHALMAVALFAAVVPAAGALDISDGEEILEAVDGLRNFVGGDFAAVMTMISEDPDEGVEKQVVQQFRRDDEEKFLMLIQEPAVKLGQGYLQVDDTLWFYDPESRQFTHTSMKERFSGSDARNSDFGRSSITDDYAVTDLREGTLGSYQVYILELSATNNEVTYPHVVMWVTRDLFLPLKVEDYSETQRLMRTSLYPSYARAGDTYIATTMIFVDELIEGKKTQISLTDISVEPLPDSIFTKAYVERVNR